MSLSLNSVCLSIWDSPNTSSPQYLYKLDASQNMRAVFLPILGPNVHYFLWIHSYVWDLGQGFECWMLNKQLWGVFTKARQKHDKSPTTQLVVFQFTLFTKMFFGVFKSPHDLSGSKHLGWNKNPVALILIVVCSEKPKNSRLKRLSVDIPDLRGGCICHQTAACLCWVIFMDRSEHSLDVFLPVVCWKCG